MIKRKYKSVITDFNAFQKEKLKGEKGDTPEIDYGRIESLVSESTNRRFDKDKNIITEWLKDYVPKTIDEKVKSIRDNVTPQRGLQGLKGETGAAPQHNWSGTSLSFQNPDGTWGNEVDLKGDKGDTGADGNNKNSVAPRVFSTSIDAVRGLRSILSDLQAENMAYDKLIDTVSDVKYIGEAKPGTKQSDALWRIKKVDLSDAGGDIEVVFADGTAEFTKVWDDRLSYNYVVES